MRTISYNSPEQLAIAFPAVLFWWGTIRHYYKSNNHLAICLDMMYENLLDFIDEKKIGQ